MADLVVASPGVSLDQAVFEAARDRGIEIIGELELAWRWIKGQVVAITGTKGKSTTTTLVGRMLAAGGRKVLVSGNIGVPLSAHVEQSTPDTLHVVETSSFQLETTSTFRPWVAVWLNLADDHLDRHPSVAAYAAAKARIFVNQTANDWAVVNADDPVVIQHSVATKAAIVRFSIAGTVPAGVVVDGAWIVRRTATASERLIPLAAVELTGRHMLTNVLAAAATSGVAGISPQAMVDGLRGFRGLEHVMEPAGAVGAVRFVNDSKATNIEAARCSIESFEGGVVAILGGRFKGGSFAALREPLATRGRAVIAIGEAAPLIQEALGDVLPVVTAASMRDAVVRGYEGARPNGVVLLAPACASFDWFRDYAERGRTFKSEVQQLKEEVERR
jgi:UDP-N-acetylmuramoylalanine--D-glutamate ligase